jgi:Cys-rich repeat protein
MPSHDNELVRSAATSWRRAFAGALALLAAGVLAASCGGDDGDDSSSASSNLFGTCSLGGSLCQLRCSEGFGCVECLDNTQCAGGKPACIAGECEVCATSADCGTGKACFPKNHTCEDKCAVDGDCPGDAPTCVPATGECVGCVTNQDCAGDSGHPVCNLIHGQCSECATSADCGLAEPVCDLQAGECRDCLLDAHCPAGSACAGDHKCHATCGSNADCGDPNKPFCDVLGKKECVACLVGLDCLDATFPICNDFHCVQCVADADCTVPGLLVCKGDVCVECDGDQDCTDPAFPKCKGHECRAN